MILNGGNLLLFQIHLIGEKLSLRLVSDLDFSDAVYAISPKDHRNLIIGSGSEVKIVSLVGVAQNKLQVISSLTLDARIISISNSLSNSAFVLAATQKSFTFLTLEHLENKIQLKNSSGYFHLSLISFLLIFF